MVLGWAIAAYIGESEIGGEHTESLLERKLGDLFIAGARHPNVANIHRFVAMLFNLGRDGSRKIGIDDEAHLNQEIGSGWVSSSSISSCA